jgi:glycosyltransferase involved in cell wall biosynthesis
LLYETADRIIVHSRAAKRLLIERFHAPASKVHVIAHGNLADFAKPVSQAQARKHLGLSSATGVVLFFGIIREYKGLDDLIRAFAIVRDHLPRTHLLIVGHPYRRTAMRPYYALLRKYHLMEITHLRLNYVPYTELGIYFGAADLVALPYKHTYDSGVLPTAYTFRRPVITTEVGGLAETVDIGRSGLVVPPGDIAQLASAIVELLSDRKRLQQMGDYAYRLAHTRHNWSAIAKMTAEVYREACQSICE